MNTKELTALERYIKQNDDLTGTVGARRANQIMRSLGSQISQEPWRCPIPTCRGTREFDGRAHNRRTFWALPKGQPKPFFRVHYFERCECTIEEVCIALEVSDSEWSRLLQPRRTDERRPRTADEIAKQRDVERAESTSALTPAESPDVPVPNYVFNEDEA